MPNRWFSRPMVVGFLGLGALALTQTGEAADPTAITRVAAVLPLVDHHQHLLGPSALPLQEALLPPIQVPPEIEALLAARARIYGNVRAPSDLAIYMDDAQIISWVAPSRWVRGLLSIKDVLSAVVAQPYEFQPNAFALEGSSGYVAGIVYAGPAEKREPRLDFLMALRKDAQGKWRIAAESTIIKSAPRYPKPIDAAKVVSDLDDAGIGRSMVISVAYWLNEGRFPNPADEMGAEYAAVRAENDWVAMQVSRFPKRLLMACSASLLRAYVVDEMKRCARLPQNAAFKLHFADADVDLRKPEHMAQVRKVFAAANSLKLPLIVHFAPRFKYGREYVDLFLGRVMSAAPDIPVQIAHLGGDGPGLDHPEGTAAFASAIAAKRPGTRNLWFDIGGLVTHTMADSAAEALARAIRSIGLSRILYGSDGQPPNRSTDEHWTQVRRKLPLKETELRSLARNVAPSMQLRAQTQR